MGTLGAPYYANGIVTLYEADARALPLADASVDCVVTSPPYWGLRDYGNDAAVWGGDSACEHEWGAAVVKKRESGGERSYGSYDGGVGRGPSPVMPESTTCQRCGAWRGSLGMEPTPEQYVAHMVEVFREVRRVLKPTGTLWLNLGDSYAGAGPSGASYQSATTVARQGKAKDGVFRISKTLSERGLNYAQKKPTPPQGLKPKDLVGVPWRVAFALQADGWWLRSDIVWSKPNPMPESVTDRPTKAHEYLFLLAKAERYYYDADAIREPALNGGRVVSYDGTTKNNDHENRTYPGAKPRDITVADHRNKRDVWTVATQPYPEAHFATFPEALVEPCILAGCPEGGTVLDPFVGSGTTAAVAQRLGRRAVGVDLSCDYLKLARKRLERLSLPMAFEVGL